jgi:glycosyltransferase involved in cell wall biosynthesis
MKISVAIPIYQQADLLPYALKSIKTQNINIQLALMDATPDDSVEKSLEDYRDLLSYHRHDNDSGQTSAIQEGWDNTDGDIIAWLCADDYYFPNTISIIEEIFSENPNLDVVYGDTIFVDEYNRFLGYFPSIKKNMKYIKQECCISQPSCFVRRTAFEKINGKLNENLHYIMDWDLWTRLYDSDANFHYVNKPLSVVRMYENTKTSSRSWRRFFEISRHLFSNTNPINATRSLLGFHYQNLLISKPTNLIDKLTLKTIRFYQSKKEHYSKNSNLTELNYGFANKDNLVAPDVDIYFPWYEDSPPTRIIVDSDLDIAPIAYLNGIKLHISDEKKFCYGLPNMDISKHLLHIKLSSVEKKLWHLYSVQFL